MRNLRIILWKPSKISNGEFKRYGCGHEVQKEVTDKYSLRGRVFHRLREDILAGEYKEGEELKEITIGAEMGVSRTPVREALRQLELEGLVKIIPNKGAYVTGISEGDIHDIYYIRSYLEGLCARWACRHITKEQIEQLEEIVYLSEFHVKKKHMEQLVELDNKFHEIIYEASKSRILGNLLHDFHHYVERARRISLASGKGRQRRTKSMRRFWKRCARARKNWRKNWRISMLF